MSHCQYISIRMSMCSTCTSVFTRVAFLFMSHYTYIPPCQHLALLVFHSVNISFLSLCQYLGQLNTVTISPSCIVLRAIASLYHCVFLCPCVKVCILVHCVLLANTTLVTDRVSADFQRNRISPDVFYFRNSLLCHRISQKLDFKEFGGLRIPVKIEISL
jgi:hypothetical protein